VQKGYAQIAVPSIVCGVYNLSGNSYSLPEGDYDTYHMGWDQELFG
jgi:hypothetical protein